MHKLLLIIGLLALPVTSHAAAALTPATIPPGEVLSAVVGEWSGDGTPDHALLVRRGKGDVDLYIFISDPIPGDRYHMKLASYAPGFSYVSDRNDDIPQVQAKTYETLQFYYGHEVTVSKGHETLTLSYRGGKFVVSGITAYSFDPSLSKDDQCDINLLTGIGTVNKKPVKVPAGGIPVTEWNYDKMPEVCKF